MQKQFLDIMADKQNLPVLVHDGKGEGRVAILAAVWLAKDRRDTIEQVLANTVEIKKGPLTEQETNFLQGLFK